MALPVQRQHEIERLLLMRERLFVHIREIEQQVDDLLGEPYPFEAPEHVPDSLCPKDGRTAPPRDPGNRKHTLPPLAGDETGYRVVYRSFDTLENELHSDRIVLQNMLNTPAVRDVLVRVETVDAEGRSKRIHFQAPDGCKT